MSTRVWKTTRFMRLAVGLLIGFCIPFVIYAQDELRAYRQIAFESGHGTLTVKRALDDHYYALNRPDRCVWMFSSSGSTTGRISSIGMGPTDLLSPKDLAVDREGNAIIADGSGAVKIFSPSGQFLMSIPFERPEHLATLSDNRILVSGFPKDYLMSVFDRQGRLLGKIGTPANVDEQAFFNAVLNMGTITVDDSDNIYYVFKYMLTPTIRKYKPDGTLVAEWHLTDGAVLAQILAAAKRDYQQNKKSGSYGGVPVLTAAAFDQDSKMLWVASGAQITELDSSGHTFRVIKLARPDGRPVQVEGLLVDRNTIRVSTYLAGIFEYQKPQ